MSLTPDEIRAFGDLTLRDVLRRAPDLADTALALYERNEQLEAVVRALAESYVFDKRLVCHLCGTRFSHAPSCPWRQARELTEGAG